MKASLIPTMLLATALVACGIDETGTPKERKQDDRLAQAVRDVVCAESRSETENALWSLAYTMRQSGLFEEDGHVHEDYILSIAEDADCSST